MDAPRARTADAPRVRTRRSGSAYADAALLVVCVLIASLAALRLQQDANWDLQNYHFYDPWAWLSGRIFDWDIAAAQLQTFHNPLPDVPFYALVAAGVDPRIITLWLALPTGIAAYCFLKLGWLLFADLRAVERAGATAAAAIIGFTGAMGIGQLGSTTDEWLVAAFTMAGLWLLVRDATAVPDAATPARAGPGRRSAGHRQRTQADRCHLRRRAVRSVAGPTPAVAAEPARRSVVLRRSDRRTRRHARPVVLLAVDALSQSAVSLRATNGSDRRGGT